MKKRDFKSYRLLEESTPRIKYSPVNYLKSKSQIKSHSP